MKAVPIGTLLALFLMASCGRDDQSNRARGTMLFVGPDVGTQNADASVWSAPDAETLIADASLANTDGGQTDEWVESTFRIINPATGRGFSGVVVRGPLNEAVTNGQGQADLMLNTGQYEVQLEAMGARRHRVVGVAGTEHFQQTTYLSPDVITGAVFGALGINDDDSRGILVVGLDSAVLAPAVGAEASISVEGGQPFVFQGNQPALGATIPTGGQGFVTFPNVTPGMLHINVTYPDGQCLMFPAEIEANEVTVYPGEVTVVAFVCRLTSKEKQ
jgi:hypothetical protein